MKPTVTASFTLLAFGLAACNSDSALQPHAQPLPATASLGNGFHIQAKCAAPPSGLVSWWRGDGNAADATGGNHGTLANGTLFATGKVGDAFLLDGVNDDVLIGTKANLNVGIGASSTMQAWIRPEGASQPGGAASGPILEYVNGVHLWQFQLPTQFYVNLVAVSGAYHNVTANGVTQNAWNHVAVTYVRATGIMTMYINGAVAASQNIGTFDMKTNTELHIGNRPTTSFVFPGAFKGRIDDVEVYGRDLSTAEIQAIYNQGVSGACQLVANAGSPATGTEGTSVSFNGSASTGQPSFTYDWDFGDGSPHGADPTATHTYKDNGVYTVTLKLTDGLLTSTATTSATISNAVPVPTLTLQTTPPIHVGQSFVLRAGFSDAGVIDGPWGYKLFRNTTLLQQGTKPTQPPPGATQAVNLTAGPVGTYTFKLEITDKDGATGVVTRQVQVVP